MTPPRLMIVEDDATFAAALKRSFERRGWQVAQTHQADAADAVAATFAPSHAVVDLRLGDGSGLAVVERLHQRDPSLRIVVLTGYASIATAVQAIKLGATNYLSKPAGTDDILAAFGSEASGDAPEPAAPTAPASLRTLEWEHIQQVLADADFNISEAARRLGMHRRTLARKLGKRHL